MKAVILAGGLGTRLSEETVVRPKPMVDIGGRPILWHIMKLYSHHGVNDFVICLGYKGYTIKEYFANYFLHMSDVTINLRNNSVQVHQNSSEPWTVTLVDTGDDTGTGGRLRRVRQHVDDAPFCFTYGDGVSDVDIRALIAFHEAQKTLATVTAVQPPGRFGAVELDHDRVRAFAEKPRDAWVSGGYFILEPEVLDRIEGDATAWEHEPMESLARDRQLSAFRHSGFFQPMDTMRDRLHLEELWASGRAPWKVWT
ncbi:MAG TPA: glucose-1-phosphate cytidylyltransferase [Thermoanaerobaculia bacterium]|nr:glucose-1-phosphate cytidylyltransferase [Thermoanaerobaculia bacterium]